MLYGIEVLLKTRTVAIVLGVLIEASPPSILCEAVNGAWSQKGRAMVKNNGRDSRELSGVKQTIETIVRERLEEKGSDSSVNDTEPQVQDVVTKPRRISPVLELATRLVEEADHLAKQEAKRAEEIEAARVRAQGIVQAAEWKADQLQSELRALADNVTEEMRSALTRINDLISALTNSIDLHPATDCSAKRSHDKLDATNETAT